MPAMTTRGFHIGLNAHLLSAQAGYRRAGISGYIFHLLRALPDADPTLSYTVFTGHQAQPPGSGWRAVRRTPWSTESPLRRIVWEQIAQPATARRAGVDLLHALAVPHGTPDAAVHQAFGAAFAGPEHIRLERGPQTALLVHGFAGTPDELRGLAESLHRAGWTVSVPLLPGFGADIATLPEREHGEWQAAVLDAGRELAADGRGPDLLVGYSLGAALSVAAANTLRPAGLVLLAPFHWPEPWWLRPAEFFVRPFLPVGFRPLRKADFSDPRLAAGIRGFMPDVDLGDPQVQAAMRDFRVPLSLIDQVRTAGRRMLAAAPQVTPPVLIIQGSRDTVARPAGARKLLARLPRGARYVEVDGEHDLMRPGNSAWPDVERALLDFAAEVTDR